MKRSRLAYLLLIPIAFLLMGARQIPLVDPAPIAVPAGLTVKAVSSAIRTGVSRHGWIVNKDDAGKMEAILNIRKHSTRVTIAYDKANVKIAYAGSENLLYEEKNGQRFIHRNYQNWLNNLVSDISSALQIAAAK
jgi:hypothetical protein